MLWGFHNSASGRCFPSYEAIAERADCTRSTVYKALEDNLRRLQARMTKLLGLQQWPDRLQFLCEMPRLAEGGLAKIKEWIAGAEHPRLVILTLLPS